MRIFHVLVFILLVGPLAAQKPFEKEIAGFHKQDSIHFPGTGKILFIGSSSFRLWPEVQSDFPNHPIINRGFGGSTFPDLLLYKDEIIKPYAPKQILVYCGDNDLASGATPGKVLEDFQTLFQYIRSNFPKCHVAFVSIKPSPSRANLLPNVKEANRMIREFLARQKDAVFIDVFSRMLDEKGNFREEIFVADRLHMNRKGYDIWKEAIAPVLR